MMERMIKNLQKKSNKKGFTLVEIIVVLVILAILAAIAIPSVMGYVNDAKNAKYIQEARSIYLVCQVEEARVQAEANDKTKEPDWGEVATTAQEKTGLKSITISKTGDKYELSWTSDKAVSADLTSNKDVKIK